MPKLTSCSALLFAFVLGTPAFAQECCESYVVYEMPASCHGEYVSGTLMPMHTWYSEPIFTDEIVSEEIVDEFVADEFVSDEVVLDEGDGFVEFEEPIVVNNPIVYEERLFWNGCYWQTTLIAVPEFAGDQVVFDPGESHTVGRATYESDAIEQAKIEGQVISVAEDEAVVPSEDFNQDLTGNPIVSDEDGDSVDSDSDNGDSEVGQPDDSDSDDGDSDDGDSDNGDSDVDEDDGLSDK